MEFQQLGIEERKLLFKALNMPYGNLHCFLCGESVSYKNCSIMPRIYDCPYDAVVLCDSLLCITEYLNKLQQEKTK